MSMQRNEGTDHGLGSYRDNSVGWRSDLGDHLYAEPNRQSARSRLALMIASRGRAGADGATGRR
jgi:hypothetical protein